MPHCIAKGLELSDAKGLDGIPMGVTRPIGSAECKWGRKNFCGFWEFRDISKTVQGVLSMNGKEEIYVLYRMMALPMTLSNHNHPSYPILRFESSFLQRAAMLALQALH